jgi:hypothetical protein
MSSMNASVRAFAAAALEVSRERERVLCDLRLALLRDDHEATVRLARRLCGLGGGDAEGDLDRPGFDDRAGD